MTPFTSLLLPIALSAVAAFLIPMLIYAVMPWHRTDYIKLPDEDGVMAALRAFKLPPNDYMMPHPGRGAEMKSPEFDAKCDAGPVMIVTVAPNGQWNMGKVMGAWFLFVLVVSASVACIVASVIPPGGEKQAVFRLVAEITFLAYATGAVPMSIWYRRKWSTAFKTMVDSVLYALATGGIFAWLWPKM